MIIRSLRETFAEATNISVLDTVIPDRVAYLNAASLGLPVHRIDKCLSSKRRRSPCALEIMQALAIELFPEWRDAISSVMRCAEPR
jgi:chromosome partitioning related protein ParA